ncbi:histidine--tRNA ligase [Patescibacteria group bacterium]|nr:histidine--tRNA ligase [Patescibacteria group bacterium]
MTLLIAPEVPGGFRDYLPVEQTRRTQILRTIEKVYQSFGFLPLDTPEVERWSVLTGNEVTAMKIYKVSLGDKTDEPLALRFDLTVPLARVVAAYGNTLPRPFKRYQLGRVFRGETSQKGRYNGFYQFDIDTVFSGSMLTDAEVIAVIWSTFQALKIPRVTIKINDRKILNGLAEMIGVGSKANILFQILDRMDKLGMEEVTKILQRPPDNRLDETALNLSDRAVETVQEFLRIAADSTLPLEEAAEFFGNSTQIGHAGIQELQQVRGYVQNMGVPDDRVVVDLSVARGLGYYTGPVFETSLDDLPSIGSVFSGGRYDGLVGRFANDSVPATGASIGVDRLFAALEELNALQQLATTATQVFILVFDQSSLPKYLQVANRLRENGLATELHCGDDTAFKAQLAYAVKQGIPLLVIGGPEELEKGIWQVKDLRTREQAPVTDTMLVAHLHDLLLNQ